MALAPPDLGKLEFDSTLLMLPNSLDEAEDRLLILVPLPLLLTGEAASAALTAVGGDGDLHFIVARSAAVNDVPAIRRWVPSLEREGVLIWIGGSTIYIRRNSYQLFRLTISTLLPIAWLKRLDETEEE